MFQYVFYDKGCVTGSWRVMPNSSLHLLTLLNVCVSMCVFPRMCVCVCQPIALSLLELVVELVCMISMCLFFLFSTNLYPEGKCCKTEV